MPNLFRSKILASHSLQLVLVRPCFTAAIRTQQAILIALSLMATNASFADAQTTVFYYDKNHIPVARLDRIKSLPESTQAILAIYALQNGAGCGGRTDAGLQCKLTQALGFKAQCSPEHIAIVRKWFYRSVPALNTRASAKELDGPQVAGSLETLCYGQPDTASWQNIWEVIKITSKEDVVSVQAMGRWSSTNGTGKFAYLTRFRTDGKSIEVLSNQKTQGN